MIVRLFKVTEALLVATTISVGLSAGYSIISGSSPPDINTFITSVVPPYESDDKRIYPNILEDKELYPSEEHHE